MRLFTLQAAEQDYEKEKLNERIAKLSGGVAVIQVLDSLKCVNILVWYYGISIRDIFVHV